MAPGNSAMERGRAGLIFGDERIEVEKRSAVAAHGWIQGSRREGGELDTCKVRVTGPAMRSQIRPRFIVLKC
jgi:hypothetical protein